MEGQLLLCSYILSYDISNILEGKAIFTQLRAIKCLTCQGIALRGHKQSEGNIHQLLLMWSKNDEIIKS